MPRKRRRKEYIRQPGDLKTLVEFCDSNRISLGTYYTLKRAGKGPRETRAGKRVLISPEAEAAWRRAREKEP